MDRFFCSTVTAGAVVELDDAETHHLQHVLRHKQGDRVELFDGQGRSATGEIVKVGRRNATLQVQDDVAMQPPSLVELTLAVAPPKGERLRWLIEKATELGVSRLALLATERSVTEPRDSRLAKLEQTVIAACKQSRRNRFMEIQAAVDLEEFLVQDAAEAKWIANPGGSPFPQQWKATASVTRLSCLIGPEGGFSAEELEIAKASQAAPVALGSSILRVETAAIAVASFVLLSQSAS
jgi:16S rRNA (uracil1498-N3)-methyltransferase